MERIMENIKSFNYEDFKINIWHDQDPMNPREWDNIGKMVCFHNRYKLGDDHDFRDSEDFDAFLVEEKDKLYILPLYLYDHGGITMKTSPFSCGWDSGQVGFIFVEKGDETRLYDSEETITTARLTHYLGFLSGYFQSEINKSG